MIRKGQVTLCRSAYGLFSQYNARRMTHLVTPPFENLPRVQSDRYASVEIGRCWRNGLQNVHPVTIIISVPKRITLSTRNQFERFKFWQNRETMFCRITYIIEKRKLSSVL